MQLNRSFSPNTRTPKSADNYNGDTDFSFSASPQPNNKTQTPELDKPLIDMSFLHDKKNNPQDASSSFDEPHIEFLSEKLSDAPRFGGNTKNTDNNREFKSSAMC
jgi:hypothetical protein